jgi:hypothetical protein
MNRNFGLSTLPLIALATMVGTVALQARDPYTFSFYSSDRNRTYTITTQEVAYSLKFGGHWLYQPSLLLPGPETGNLRVLVFNSNLTANVNGVTGDEAIFVTSDVNNTLQFPAPTAVLRKLQSTNICDMADARPIWDGTRWHVYVQAVLKDTSGVCSTTNSVIQAVGSSLYSLAWDVVPGTQNAKVVVAGAAAAGIGEDMQWFYSLSAPEHFVATYNDWGNPLGGTLVKGAYTADGSSNLTQWYSTGDAWNPYLGGQGYTSPQMYPDALLSGSLDEPTFGPPGIGAQSSCYTTGFPATNKYQYSRVFGFFPSPLQSNALSGVAPGGALRSIYNDMYGERMFRPRFARDSHGFVPLYSTGTVRTWKTFVMYNPMQIEANTSDACDKYTNWGSSDQEFAFSLVTITEQ